MTIAAQDMHRNDTAIQFKLVLLNLKSSSLTIQLTKNATLQASKLWPQVFFFRSSQFMELSSRRYQTEQHVTKFKTYTKT